ncbi:hypothetical protein V8Z74_24535 [Comamonas sp. w2-DMI]|uniref:hypothetical protein n=1 Tax=Comamonas sp. w2-DMI TaxID=3126391 RepID=UPI0032E38808
MKKTLKQWIVSAYYAPRLTLAVWRLATGRFFIFRDESQGFLNYLWAVKNEPKKARHEGNPNAAFLVELLELAMEEIAMRKQNGTWVEQAPK